MKDILNKKVIVIAAIAVLIAIITIVSINVFDSGGPVTGIANAVSRPVKSLVLSVARSFESIYNSIYNYEALQNSYEEAMSELTAIRRAYAESDDLLRENNMYRALYGFVERHEGYILEEASIENWGSDNWSSTFKINKGYANSVTAIARGNSVITEYGVLIGQITEVSATSSTVVSVLDTTFSASAFVGDGEGSVTAKGDFTLMGSGLLMLDHLSEDIIILPGDSVVTSGAGDVFPIGLVIGEVDEVLRHSTGIGRYATVKPMRAIEDSIMDVYVITSFDITGE